METKQVIISAFETFFSEARNLGLVNPSSLTEDNNLVICWRVISNLKIYDELKNEFRIITLPYEIVINYGKTMDIIGACDETLDHIRISIKVVEVLTTICGCSDNEVIDVLKQYFKGHLKSDLDYLVMLG